MDDDGSSGSWQDSRRGCGGSGRRGWSSNRGEGGRGGGRGRSRYRPYNNNWRGRGRGSFNKGDRTRYDDEGLTPPLVPRPRSNHLDDTGFFPRNFESPGDVSSEPNTMQLMNFGNGSFQTNSLLEMSLNSDLSPVRLKQQKLDRLVTTQMAEKYPGFGMYFSTAMSALADIPEKIGAVAEYFDRSQLVTKLKAAADVEERQSFELNFEDMMNDQPFVESWPSFERDLLDNAEDVLNILGLCVHTVVQNLLTQELNNHLNETGFSDHLVRQSKSSPAQVTVPRITIRLLKLTPLTPIKSIRSTILGKFVTIRGAVIRTGTVKPYCVQMTYQCTDCLHKFILDQIPGHCNTSPSKCPSLECRSKSFESLEMERTTEFGQARIIRLQDIHSEEGRGTVPKSIDCRLSNTLINSSNAGDAVTICGVVKFESTNTFGGDPHLHNFYIDVIAVRNHKDCDRTMGGNWFSFTNKDYYAVEEIHDSPQLFRLLVASLCPTIFGHDLVKLGLLLSLFGGSPPSSDNHSVVPRRSDINVLIVGDPGIGKSQMLTVVCDVAPKGVYVCGTATTVAGLTVTLVKDGDDYSLEAGALVMADRGVCCIDEFDKMQSQHHALLETMEQQSVSIAKSGVFRTISARTSVVAAANPVGGHYDARKSVAENIRINPSLLSRFDLVFILVDKSDEEADRNIVNHILGTRRVGSLVNRSQARASTSILVPSEDQSLTEKLKFSCNEPVDLIPHHLLRKYIAYARQYVSPVLSPEAAAVIKKYYIQNRAKHRGVDTTPVTTRQLESLLRLTQARAKLELRETATEQDAKDVLEIFEFGMSAVLEDDLIVGTPLSQLKGLGTSGPKRAHTRGMAKKLLSTLQGVSNKQAKNIFTLDEIRGIAASLGVGNGIETLVSALNTEGFLLNKGGKVYQLQSTDF